MARTAYELIAQPWLRTPLTARTKPARGRARAKWPFFAALAVPALAGLARALFSRGHRPAVKRVKDLMVCDVVTVDPAVTLAEAARRMRDHNVGILPVVMNGELAGVITDRDLVVRALAEGADPELTLVGEFASAEPISARPDTPLGEAMEAMAALQLGRLPVVDDNNRVVGIVTLGSLALRSREEKQTLHAAQEVSRRSAHAA
jgi:CBS domain-containing protein